MTMTRTNPGNGGWTIATVALSVLLLASAYAGQRVGVHAAPVSMPGPAGGSVGTVTR